MNTVFVTWLALVQWGAVVSVIRVINSAHVPYIERNTYHAACVIILLAVSVPTLYVTGWLLLPAWGVGHVTPCSVP